MTDRNEFFLIDGNPELEEALTELETCRKALEKAWTPLQKEIDDLEQDYDTRSRAFWQQALQELIGLKKALQECLSWQEAWLSDLLTVPAGLFDIRYPLMHCWSRLKYLIDDICILVTAYKPHAEERHLASLRERHDILKQLRYLADETQKTFSLMGPEAQQACRERQWETEEEEEDSEEEEETEA